MPDFFKTCPKFSLFFWVLFAVLPFNIYAQNDSLPTASSTSEKISNDEFQDSEFEAFDEFENFNQSQETENISCTEENGCCNKKKGENLNWVLGILAFTVMAGFFVRYAKTRNLRGFFLVASVVILGFYKGACPCPISSFQNLLLAGFGVTVDWHSLVWFLALLPVTYLFGRIYCGWICHLGALQEFIYLPAKIKILQGEKAQKIMRTIRIVFLVALIVQLFITKTNLFKHYDPFKVAFNLIGTNTLSWILLGVLLICSVFIYRPFCKTVCPIGLVLGWVNKIPGASVIGNNESCVGCKSGDNICKIRAITRDEKMSKLDNHECISCGECISSCNKNALQFFRNNKKTHHDQVICKKLDL